MFAFWLIRFSGPIRGISVPGATAALKGQTDPRFESESGKIDVLSESGFYTFDKWRLSSETDIPSTGISDTLAAFMNQIERIYSGYIDNLRDAWNFETDGLVVLVDDNRLHDAIDERWEVDHHHHYAMAFKPPAQTAQTVLKNIVWQVSRQGNLSPVANFEPVHLTGATIERASLHNADNVSRLKLAVGDTLLVERANDVIPYVRENISADSRPADFKDAALWPECCPSCASALVKAGVNISCPNTNCRARVLQSILYWVRQAEMNQIAMRTLEALYNAG